MSFNMCGNSFIYRLNSRNFWHQFLSVDSPLHLSYCLNCVKLGKHFWSILCHKIKKITKCHWVKQMLWVELMLQVRLLPLVLVDAHDHNLEILWQQNLTWDDLFINVRYLIRITITITWIDSCFWKW